MSFLYFDQKVSRGELNVKIGGSLVSRWRTADRIVWKVREIDLPGLNERLEQDVEHLRKRLETVGPGNAKGAAEALNSYIRAANEYWQYSSLNLVSSAQCRSRLRNELLKHAQRVWAQAEVDPYAAARHAPTIQSFCRNMTSAHVPLELLPLGAPTTRNDDLWASLSQLPSFYSAWQSIFVDGATIGSIIPEGPSKPSARVMLRGVNAPNWKSMKSSLSGGGAEVLPDIPFANTFKDNIDAALFILSPRDLTGSGRPVSDVHVYAHGRVGESFRDAFCIDLVYGSKVWPKGSYKVTTLDFKDAVEMLKERDHHPPSLIWLNCCHAGGKVGKELFSQAARISSAAASIIAPRVEVPNYFARDFAAAFYRGWTGDLTIQRTFLGAKLERACMGDPSPIFFYCLGPGVD
ncbi:hypothetical protein [Streptomyces sp. NPDC001851]|uniref:hypothetical protein n=1 Tax=Streptomyces sp. NPDC001851 TaxID=3154529 RepID=UPI003316CB3D